MNATERSQVRNETIDEMCDWLESCIQQVNHDSEVYKACEAMVHAMRGKKTPEGTSYPGPH